MTVMRFTDTIHPPFISFRRAELLNYGAWEVADMQSECGECSCMIMTGDKTRSSADSRICATCGEE